MRKKKEPQNKTLQFEEMSGVDVADRRSIFDNKARVEEEQTQKTQNNSEQKSPLETSYESKEDVLKRSVMPAKMQAVEINKPETPGIEKSEELTLPSFSPVMYNSKGREVVKHGQENEISLKLKNVEQGDTTVIENIHDSSIRDNYFLKQERGELEEESIEIMRTGNRFHVSKDTSHEDALKILKKS